ncbi:MAG: DUF294 nucleotidyltransferase-like domain-containing protein, partial [Pseudomonadota bacterium]
MTEQMAARVENFTAFAQGRAPFRGLSTAHFDLLCEKIETRTIAAGTLLLELGDQVEGLYVLTSGRVHLLSAEDELVSDLFAGDVFGQRSLAADGKAKLKVLVVEDTDLTIIDPGAFKTVLAQDQSFAQFFQRRSTMAAAKPAAETEASRSSLLTGTVGDIMSKPPRLLPETASLQEAGQMMHAQQISCILTTDADGMLAGIVTTGDLVSNVVAQGVDAQTPLTQVATRDPLSVRPGTMLIDAVSLMTERRIGHLPVIDEERRPVGIVTRTDLIRRNTSTIFQIISQVSRAADAQQLSQVTAQKPKLLAELVGAGIEGHMIGRIMTRVTDAVTKRLIELAMQEIGPAPAEWLWLACGSQGRREQTGVSDQDNCLFLQNGYVDAEHDNYFERFAKFVCDGLDVAGYFYCPGDMMAMNPRWRVPVDVWQSYFDGWIKKPDPMAQMLASVMFDLRPIAGEESLFEGLQETVLEKASRDSIFRAHMTTNSLKHQPPLGLFGGLSYVRDAEHKNAIDLKHSGVVPITDLGRLYALHGQIPAANTRDRIIASRDMDGVLSKSGGDDLVDAYDLICDLRLKHQANQIKLGEKPDNFMIPDTLSALERNH